MNIVKVFGQLVDVVGSDEISIESKSIVNLRENLIISYPELKKYTFQISINHEIEYEDIALKSSDKIALLPPFAGG